MAERLIAGRPSRRGVSRNNGTNMAMANGFASPLPQGRE